MVYFIRYLWIISTSVMFIIGFIYPVSFSLHYGTSFCYGTLLILFSMLFISVTKSYCVSCLLNTLSLALDLYEIHSVFSSSLLHFFGLHLYIYNCIWCPHVKYVVSIDQCMDWNLYNEHKKGQEKGLKLFYLLPWLCAFGVIILKEGSLPLLVQMVRLITLCILTQKGVGLLYSLWLSIRPGLFLYRP